MGKEGSLGLTSLIDTDDICPFYLSLNYRPDLDKGKNSPSGKIQVPDSVRLEFQTHSFNLDVNANLIKLKKGERWLIIDNDIRYNLKNDSKQINVSIYNPKQDKFKFSDIVKIDANKLTAIFNYFMIYLPHDDKDGLYKIAREYWDLLQMKCNVYVSIKTSNKANVDLHNEIIFLIKYLIVDCFGCSIPHFIDFDFILRKKDQPINGIEHEQPHTVEFENIFINKYDFVKGKEVHSGW